MIQFDEHIYHMGWFNHQPDIFNSKTPCDMNFSKFAAPDTFKWRLPPITPGD